MKKILFLCLIAFCLTSCTSKKNNRTIFKKLNHTETGVSFSNTLTETDSLNYFTYAYMYMGGGVAAGDMNNDGLIDLFFTGNMVSNKLYLNKGNLKFEDISKKANIQGDNRWFTGVTIVDINNDGYLDIYCSVSGKNTPKENLLYINNKDLTFTESAEKYGIADAGNSVQSTFFDYDLDGDLDLYVGNYPRTNFNAPNNYYRFKMSNTKKDETDKLYRNDGNSFTDVTDKAGLRTFGLTLSATIGDLNNDGWPDIYVSNDFSSPDFLYINNKNGTFTEQIKKSTKQTAFYGMGVDIADFNNDNLLDVIQVDMMAKNNRRAKANMASMNPDLFWGTVNAGFHYQYMQNNLQLNNGTLHDSLPDFSNIARLAGVSSTDWSWGPLFADLDNDGWKDIFISNGTRREINNRDYFQKVRNKKSNKDSFLSKSLAIPSEKIDNFVFRNNKDLTFTQANDTWGINHKGFSNGCVYADLDNDGDLEIITNNIDDYASIFKNTSTKNNFITLRFNGPNKNKFGLGVKAYVTTNETTQFQEMTLTRGFQSAVAPQLHFGLGKNTIIKKIKILWPDQKTQIIDNVKSNQFLQINYKDALVLKTKKNKEDIKLFTTETDTTIITTHKHIENYYNDFAKEILLPHQTSMFGPGVSVGDLNGDNLDDFVIGGASKSPTGIYFQSKIGFKKQQIPDISNDSESEDIGSLIFDVDSDGDNDIYIVSGGNEFSPNSNLLQDRLYINDGEGNFSRSVDALPKMITSGSRVYKEDYDKDGDLDLLVTGRLVPGNYPLAANSYILENVSTKNNPKFINVTQKIAPGLEKLGMATSAVWTDYNSDGWVDLIIVGEWMPITVFKNNNGIFKNETKKLNLEDTTGWWFSIKQGDFDKDGDLDYIVGNLGLNYKYKANSDETFDIYFKDFDQNKSSDIVLSYYNDGKKFPVRGRECSSQQIPAIKHKFKNYDSFSTATLEDIYTENDLEESLHYQVKSFASIYLENKKGKFITHKLPNLAQISNINQILIDDFDKDSNLDIILAGNLHSSEVETPRNDASNGLFLKGNGDGSFKTIKTHKSGFTTSGDTKDLSMIRIKNKSYIIAVKNNDQIQFIKIQSK